MIFILILCIVSIDKIIDRIKHKLGVLIFIKTQIQNLLRIRISFSIIQNILHIPFFALLAFLWLKFFSKRKKGLKKAVVYTLTISFSFSLFSEFLQFFVLGRDASFVDLFLDFTGCLGGVATYMLSGYGK